MREPSSAGGLVGSLKKMELSYWPSLEKVHSGTFLLPPPVLLSPAVWGWGARLGRWGGAACGETAICAFREEK